ncbi:efflux RND transporter periplasmic adaptor subunit [Variovorax sp. HW608]|uniref:efflux RND transporter periplasmic adaptor subunit n=1 Tax=Variovorax sp. HW608 TaxID=1034889 RepID=UPI001E43F16A|nr:efflux RND transporter periplasmic adaptor subunit [Variovorax sp. HW608]
MKSPSSKSRPMWWAAIAVPCALIAFLGWRALRAEAPAPVPPTHPELVRTANRLFVPEESPLRKRLAVAPVDEASSAHSVSLPAVVEADPASTVNILAPATGRVLALNVRLGDIVRRGQELATISSSDYAQAVSDVQKARDALDLAERALKRARGVNDAGSNAAKDVEVATSAVVQQTAELRRSEIRLRSLGEANVSRTSGGRALLTVTTPIGGTVTALATAPGAVVNDATATMMTVANLDHVWVTVNVPEGLVGTIANGQDVAVTLAALPGQVQSGKIAFVASVLDADTRRVKARVTFSNPKGLLKPNMYASARIAVPQSREPQVPTSAVVMNNDSTSVFVEADPWTFVRRAVELGSEDGGLVRVRSGLEAGERVVVRGGVLLND